MSALIARIRNEPALALGFLAALIALGIAFGLKLSPEQQGAITALVIAVLGFVTRSQVSPAALVAAVDDGSGVIVAGPAAPQDNGTPVDVVPSTP